MWIIFSAPRGRNVIAKGNALGNCGSLKTLSPEGASRMMRSILYSAPLGLDDGMDHIVPRALPFAIQLAPSGLRVLRLPQFPRALPFAITFRPFGAEKVIHILTWRVCETSGLKE
jgi:hypothetical protein